MPDDKKDYNVKVGDDFLNAFRDFEPYLDFGESIPGPNFNLSSSSDKGWQKYDETGQDLIPSGKMISANEYKIGDTPVKGYAIGSVVCAGTNHDILSGDYDIKITKSNGKLVVEGGGTTKTLNPEPPTGVSRLGILLVGAGGNAGKKNRAHVHKKEKNGDYWLPGGGGGGGGVLWGIINLEKLASSTDYYYVKVGTQQSSSLGTNGNYTSLYFNATSGGQITTNDATSGQVAYAQGGLGGAEGQNSSTVHGGEGGEGWATPATSFFNHIGTKKGVKGGTYNYNEMSEDMDGSRIRTDAISYSIQFAKNNNLVTTKTSTERVGCGSKGEEKKKWGSTLRFPGGNSWEEAGWPASDGSAGHGAGGGGDGTHSYDGWSYSWGGGGYWILFY